jgi:hypothetical protein
VKAARYTSASAAPAGSLCAGHVQQLGGESPLPELMEVRASDNARATAARRGLKEASAAFRAQSPDLRFAPLMAQEHRSEFHSMSCKSQYINVPSDQAA